MLVRFSSQACANLLMFDDVARSLLKVIGKPPTRQGVITVDQMPEALMRLRDLVEQERRLKETREQREEPPAFDMGIEPHELVGLAVRAQPLIKSLERALGEEKPMVWEAPKDFSK